MKKRLTFCWSFWPWSPSSISIRPTRRPLIKTPLSRELNVINSFHEILYAKKGQTWLANHWLGIQTSQNPNDAWITQEIIVEQKPDVLVETGTKNGGSALIWAMIMREVNPNSRVITIDIVDKTAKARKCRSLKNASTFFWGVQRTRQCRGSETAGGGQTGHGPA